LRDTCELCRRGDIKSEQALDPNRRASNSKDTRLLTLPASTLVVNLAMKAEREGGHCLGMALPLATPDPVLMLKIGTKEGSIVTVALRSPVEVGKAETSRKRSEIVTTVAKLKICIVEWQVGVS
jgi:hypothetical protein